MSDIFGQADRVTKMFTDAAIASARNAATKRELNPCGKCHFCYEPVDKPDQIFCDGECATEYNKRVK